MDVTLKTLYAYLKLLENPAELKRKLPGSVNPRTIKEGLSEMSRLVGIDYAVFKDPQHLAAMIGPQRLVMIWGEPSVTTHVARIFDSSKVLWTVLVDPGHFERPMAQQPGMHLGPAQHPHPAGAAAKTLSASWAQSHPESPGLRPQPNPVQENVLPNLNPLLTGNTPLICRFFRVIFEHMVGFASQSSSLLDSAALVNELTGSREHGRSILSTMMFLLGVEIDRENLMSFLLEHYLFGMQIFEHLFQHRDYCAAYYHFRRLERAFMAVPAEEERQLRSRMDQFNAQFGGKPSETKIFEADDPDKTRVDAHLAAVDLLEAMALTPFSVTLSRAIAADSTNSLRSMKTIARHFERFASGQETKEQTNHEIADHLLAFARQFSADREATSSL